ncbi:GGDEF domain-containing protein [Chitinibacter tainanensis]|uniref:GGDEF domain-containing protein n=1 Tax=Chitinibacter tainanensis TaxID=230667 RepID=UPI002355ABB1|nr:GGDEF domain-containing protein [Chitinibacter tainanensis]
MDKITTWQWLVLLLGVRALLEFIPLPDVHDFYGLLITSLVLVVIWRRFSYQERLLRPFLLGVLIYWLGHVFDYIDGLHQGQGFWGHNADILDDILFAVGFCLIGIAFVRVMHDRNHLIAQLHRENQRSQALQQTLYQQAYSDELTQLGNRRALFETLQAKIAAGESGTLLYIDVNNFKPVNDRFGHEVGDEVLKRCAHYIQAPDVVAYRLGGDEFVALLGAQNPQQWILALCQRAKPLAQEYGVTFSVGCAAFGGPAPLTADALIAQADQAMYREKTSSKSRSR